MNDRRNLPKISVIVPSFNQGKYLGKTLESIFSQNYPNIEVIVMDGGSRDESVEVIKKYEDRLDYWVSEPDGGQTNGLKAGFARSTGDIQCWLNSDDLFTEGALDFVGRYFMEHPEYAAFYGDTYFIDPDDNIMRKHREIPFNEFIWTHTYNYIPGMSMFWRREHYEKVGGLDTSFDITMDADLYARIYKTGGKIGHVRKYLSCMRMYPDQKSRKYYDRYLVEFDRVCRYLWNDEKPRFMPLKRLVAQSLRMGWKLATGCYDLGYRRDIINNRVFLNKR